MKPTQRQVAAVYAQHLVFKESLYVPDAEGALLVEAAIQVHGRNWTKRMKSKGWHIAAEERLAVMA